MKDHYVMLLIYIFLVWSYLSGVVEGATRKLGAGAIAGIVIAVILIVLIVIDLFCCFFNKCGVFFCCQQALCAGGGGGGGGAGKKDDCKFDGLFNIFKFIVSCSYYYVLFFF